MARLIIFFLTAKDLLSYKVSIMATDDLVIQEGKASAAMALI